MSIRSVASWRGQIIRVRKILTADFDPGEVTEGKVDLDVAKHYARPDVFQLEVNEKAGF